MKDKSNNTPPPTAQVVGDGEASIIECLAAGKPFVFDQATNFLHADDGTVEGGIRYLPVDQVVGSEPSDVEKLRSALQAAVDTIQDYLDYTHDGDPWKEDSRAMGEMDINDYGRDGRLDYALKLLASEEREE